MSGVGRQHCFEHRAIPLHIPQAWQARPRAFLLIWSLDQSAPRQQGEGRQGREPSFHYKAWINQHQGEMGVILFCASRSVQPAVSVCRN
eukprot:1144711-Pelagomonas_calceolata.AAC.3